MIFQGARFQIFTHRSKAHLAVWLIALTTVTLLSACGKSDDGQSVVRNGVYYPADAGITKALQKNFSQDPNNAQARELVRTLGGEKGALEYTIHNVIHRQGAFITQYDVSLRMGQSGTESLQKLYASMIPKDELAKLGQATLPAYEKWLEDNAQALEKGDAQKAAALRKTVSMLGKCYRTAKTNDSIKLMSGLEAVVSPARDGWYAEKAPSPQIALLCLPI
jgi:hypothetical protein